MPLVLHLNVAAKPKAVWVFSCVIFQGLAVEVLAPTVRSVICCGRLPGCRVVSVFACGCPVVLASFVDKQSVLSAVNCLCSLVKCSVGLFLVSGLFRLSVFSIITLP